MVPFAFLFHQRRKTFIDRLKKGSISLRGAIEQPIMWIVDCRRWQPVNAWLTRDC